LSVREESAREHHGVSTRMLITLAAGTGVAILAASAVQIFLAR
jgi:hypothetical protein